MTTLTVNECADVPSEMAFSAKHLSFLPKTTITKPSPIEIDDANPCVAKESRRRVGQR